MKTFDAASARPYLEKLEGWHFNHNGIEKDFTFQDFSAAFAFMLRVGFLAESHNHHPEWSNVYNKVSIRFSTHDAAGLTEKDLKIAAAIEAL